MSILISYPVLEFSCFLKVYLTVLYSVQKCLAILTVGLVCASWFLSIKAWLDVFGVEECVWCTNNSQIKPLTNNTV